ncbi:MAG: glycosyltransferase [Alphaproteobacteria bacterium]
MSGSPRLLQAMAGAPVGGAEAVFERLAIAFARRGVAQRVAIRRDARRAATLRAGGVDVVELGVRGPLDLATRWALAREIGRFAPDVVLGWMNRACAALPPRALLPGARHVTVGRLGGYYALNYYRRCDWLVANTPDIRDWLVGQGWPAARVVHLPNFVDAEAAPAVDRVALDTPLDAKLVLALGRLHPNKGFDVLLEAVARAPGLQLWIAGEGPEEQSLRARAAALGIDARVRFLGWRRDVAALLATCDMLACPSRHEPLGNVVIEAWAHRRPVVAAASQGPRQLLRDGETGLLVPLEDADALARAMSALAADPGRAAALAGAGRGAYEAGFTEAAVVQRYLEFLAAIAGRS